MAIHTFGDSHAGESHQYDINVGFNDKCKRDGLPEGVNHHHMGAVLCNSFGTKGFELIDIS